MNWDNYFYNICNAISENSKCLSRNLGTVITKDNYIVSTGYNGPPNGCLHCGEVTFPEADYHGNINSTIWENYCEKVKKPKVCPRRIKGFKSGEGLEFCPSSHAERNAIYTAAKLGHSVDGCTLYLNCIIPCFECCKAIINSGIKEVVVTRLEDYEHVGIIGRELLKEAQIKLRVFEFSGF